MPTTPGGRWSPDDTDDWDLTVDLAAMQVSNEAATTAALDSFPQDYRTGTNAERLAITGPDLYSGLRFRTTDTNKDWLFQGGAWLPDDSGMILISRKTGTSVSGISFDGVFTSRFRRYRIDVYTRQTNANVNVRLRNGGVDDTGATSYGTSRIWLASASSASSAYTSGSAWTLSGNTGNQLYGNFDLDGPADSSMRTSAVGQFSMLDAGPGNMLTNWSAHYGTAVSHDGISILAGTGTLTGEVSIYGYAV